MLLLSTRSRVTCRWDKSCKNILININIKQVVFDCSLPIFRAVMNLRLSLNAGNFLMRWGQVGFSRKTVLHGVSKWHYTTWGIFLEPEIVRGVFETESCKSSKWSMIVLKECIFVSRFYWVLILTLLLKHRDIFAKCLSLIREQRTELSELKYSFFKLFPHFVSYSVPEEWTASLCLSNWWTVLSEDFFLQILL